MLLFVTEDRGRHSETVKRLVKYGIFLYVCPYETAEFLCRKKDIGGVVMDCVAALRNGEKLCAAFRRDYPDAMPIAAIAATESIPDLLIDRLIREGKDDLFEEIYDFCVKNCGWSTASLSTFRLTVDEDPQKNLYMGHPFPLPTRAQNILRCVFYRSPKTTPTDDLLTLCFPEGTQSVDNLATQIRKINLRAKQIDPRPLIINEYGKGYRLRDGILN